MRHGDLVTAVLPGDYGKPRPALIVQNNRVDGFDSVLVCPLSSDVLEVGSIRILVELTAGDGLRLRSEIMIEKLSAVDRKRVGDVIGRLPENTLKEVGARLAFLLDLP